MNPIQKSLVEEARKRAKGQLYYTRDGELFILLAKEIETITTPVEDTCPYCGENLNS
jgi:hypothetical protein